MNASQPVGTTQWKVTYWSPLNSSANTITTYVVCAS
jgi:hypothetical protein